MPYDEEPNKDVKEDSEQEQGEKYPFLQEIIKEEPTTKDKLFKRLAQIAIYGVIFGLFACLSFFVLKPWAQNQFQGDPSTVKIPAEEEQEQIQEEQNAEEAAVESVQPPALTAESYAELVKSLYAIAEEANKSVASITVAGGGQDWLSGKSGNVSGVGGLIVGNDGQELLVLADNSVCKDAESWNVTFCDGSKYSAGIRMQDKNLGLAVFSIALGSISSDTWSEVKVATLGNSNISKKGEAVLVLGNTFGYAEGFGYGVISSNEYKQTFPDGEYSVLATNITGAKQGTGVLVNLNSEIIGITRPGVLEEPEDNLVNALAISDLKSTVELLVNGKGVPYVGIYGTAVTDAAANEQEIPKGIYVTQVEVDSPAMAAGIQSGDVLTAVNGTKVSSLVSYHKTILECKAGENVKIKGQRRGANGYVEVAFTVTTGN